MSLPKGGWKVSSSQLPSNPLRGWWLPGEVTHDRVPLLKCTEQITKKIFLFRATWMCKVDNSTITNLKGGSLPYVIKFLGVK